MRKGNIAIGTTTSGDWAVSFPSIYSNSAWHKVRPYIYTGGSWKPVGGAGTNMVYFILSDGKYLTDSTGGYFLVRQG